MGKMFKKFSNRINMTLEIINNLPQLRVIPSEIKNLSLALEKLIIFVETELKTLKFEIAELRSLRNDLAVLEKENRHITKEILYSRLLLSRNNRLADRATSIDSSLRPMLAQVNDFSVYMEKIKNIHPHLYDKWHNINFDINPQNYRASPETSCSINSHIVAPLFGGFIAPYLKGYVLDIGCGPYPIPLYLEQYPPSLIYGIDPLPPFDSHPFEFVRGFAEFLPWQDGSFDVILAATSLDHVFSLDLAVAEIKRLLKPNGYFIVWDGFMKGSPPYNPTDPNWQAADELHLFHFDVDWFENYFGTDFSIEEKINVDDVSFFYALRKK